MRRWIILCMCLLPLAGPARGAAGGLRAAEPAPQEKKETRRFEPLRHFPESALFYLHVPSLKQLLDGAAGMTIARMWLQPPLQKFQAFILEQALASEVALKCREALGMGPLELLRLLQGEAAFAFYLIDRDGELQPAFALAIEAGGERDRLAGAAEKLDRIAEESGARVEPIDLPGLSAKRWTAESGQTLERAFLGSHMVWTFEVGGNGFLGGIAGLYAGKETTGKALAEDKELQAQMERSKVAQRALFFYGNLKRFYALLPKIAAIEADQESDIENVMQLSGIRSCSSVGYALGFQEGDLEGRVHLELGGESKGLLPILARSIEPVGAFDAALQKIPGGARGLGASRIAWGKLLEGILGEVQRHSPEFREQASLFTQRVEAAAGISLKEDLFKLPPLTTFPFAIEPPAGSWFSDLLNLAPAREAAGYVKLLEKLAGDRHRVRNYAGRKVHIADLRMLVDAALEGQTGQIARMLLQPVVCWTEIDGGWILFSNQPQPVRRYLEQYARDNPASADAALAAEAREGLRGAAAGVIIRGSKGWVSVYNTLVTLLNWVAPSFEEQLAAAGFDAGRLLPGEDFLEGFRDGMLRIESSPGRLDIHGRGVLTAILGSESSLLPIAAGSVIAGFLIPTLMRGREAAYEVQCQNNLKSLVIMSRLYADQNDKHAYPYSPDGGIAALQILADFFGDIHPKVFVCTESQQSNAKTDDDGKYKLDEDTCSYEFLPVRMMEPGEERILIYERFPHHKGRRCVAYTDGSVQVMPEGEFQEALQKILNQKEDNK